MSHVVRFDCFEADLAVGQLRSRGIKVRLRDQPFQVLASLLEHPGQVVTRDDLRQRLWRDGVFLDFDNSLNIAVARLRTALGDSASHPRFIETLPKRGYRFIGDVSSAAETEPAGRPRLAVLPFVNLSGDPGQEYFSDAMTDEIITALASLAPEQLAVIGRTTTMHYKGAHKDVTRIRHELAVDYVVEGGVSRKNDHAAINVQLIQTSDQAHLFARRYEAALPDIFRMQSSIAQGIAAHIPGIAGNLLPGIQAVGGRARKPTEDLAAYNEYIQARYEMNKMTAECFTKARRHLEKAIAADPEFALAYDALAEIHWYLGYLGFVSPRQASSAGIVHALRAIEIDN